MQVRFVDERLAQLESDPGFNAGLPQEAVRGFRKVIQLLRAASDERDLYAMRSLHFEKLKGKRSAQRSLRLNLQWRLIVRIVSAEPKNVVEVIQIEDYH